MAQLLENQQKFNNQMNKYLGESETPLSYYAVLIKENTNIFCECLLSFLKDESTVLSSSTLAKGLACALVMATQTHDHKYVIEMLRSKAYKLPEILKACEILDSARLHRQLTRKLEKLKNPKKIKKVEQQLHNIKVLNDGIGEDVELVFNFSLTKSKIKLIKKNWVSTIAPDKLEFYALTYDLATWKKFADLTHLKASDFSVEWFIGYVFGKQPPEDSIVSICKNITTLQPNEVEKLILKYKPDYDFLRTSKIVLTTRAKAAIATYTGADKLLWWLEEFIDIPSAVKEIVKTSDFELPYGVLIDKLFLARKHLKTTQQRKLNKNTFEVETISKPNESDPTYELYTRLLSIADEKLNTYTLSLESPIVIFGDASSSMSIAIKTSSIIMSILCAICNAEMNLFRTKCELINTPPKCVNDVIHFNETTHANQSTSPAASLEPYYSANKKVNTIIMVTDEEENTSSLNMRFWEMFDKYCNNLNFIPRVIFISFLSVGTKGQMISQLDSDKYRKYKEHVKQFRFNRNDPDLSKLDSILMLLSTV